MNLQFLLPLFASLGALIFEFSIAHFLGMALGNSTFAFSFAVGLFLISMGIGAYRSEEKSSKNPLVSLFHTEISLAFLCFIVLAVLVETSVFFRGLSLGSEACRTLLCSQAGLGLLAVATLFLFLVGFGVGREIPFFFQVLQVPRGQILSADYIGAFIAGVLFPLFLLPYLGLWGALSFGAFCHWCVGLWCCRRMTAQGEMWKKWLLLGVTGLCLLAALLNSRRTENFLMRRLVQNSYAVDSEVLENFRTRKQQVVLVSDKLPGHQEPDLRLYLDGFLQFSSLWNTDLYHQAMGLVARGEMAKADEEMGEADASKRILILGGGDGLLAETIEDEYPQDEIQIVDFDCQLLEAFRTRPQLRQLSPSIWEDPQVRIQCGDAFYFVKRPDQAQQWDLVLVDFPHGVGDAASSKVETWEFFQDLRDLLKSDESRVVLHHEKFESEDRECVERTLAAAGFQTRSFAVEEDELESSEAMIIGRRGSSSATGPEDFTEIQTSLRPTCTSGMRRLGHIWLGS